MMNMPVEIVNRLHLQELLLALWILFFLFATKLEALRVPIDSWPFALVGGVFSTLICYFGPIAAKAFLTPQQAKLYMDSHN
jgi:hypothetical protein